MALVYPSITDLEDNTGAALPINPAPVMGGEVTPLDGLAVMVAAGSVQLGARLVEWSQVALNVPGGDPTMDRLDLIVVAADGLPHVLAGSASTRPAYPALPYQTVMLAGVYVPPKMRNGSPTNFAALDDSLIDDKRG